MSARLSVSFSRYQPIAVPDGAAFAAIRKKRGLTQGEFADYLGLSLRTVQNYESGARRVPEWVAFRLRRLKWL